MESGEWKTISTGVNASSPVIGWEDERKGIRTQVDLMVRKKLVERSLFQEEKSETLFDELAECYKSQHSYCQYRMKEIEQEFGGRVTDDISALCVSRFRRKIIDRSSPQNWNRYRNILNAIFNRGIDWGLCTKNPVKSVKGYSEEPVKQFLNAEHAQALLKEARKHDPYLHSFVFFALKTGRRMNEILKLEWSDVDFRSGIIKYHISKKKGGFSIEHRKPPKSIFDMLSLMKKTNPEKPFPHFPRRGWRIIRDKVESDIGLPDRRFHALRHRCATEMIENGATLYDVQYYLCHSSPQTTMIYAHVSEKRDERISSFLE
jgi:integrase